MLGSMSNSSSSGGQDPNNNDRHTKNNEVARIIEIEKKELEK